MILETARYARCRRSEPSRQRVNKPWLSQLSDPRHISVGPNQYGTRSNNGSDRRQFPHTSIFGVDQANAIRPRSDIETAALTEVEQHRPRIVQ